MRCKTFTFAVTDLELFHMLLRNTLKLNETQLGPPAVLKAV